MRTSSTIRYFLILLMALLPVVSSCSKKKVHYYSQNRTSSQETNIPRIAPEHSKIRHMQPAMLPITAGRQEIKDVLAAYYSNWRGTPYRHGGMSHRGIDCSAFTYLAYKDLFTIQLPRTVSEQADQGQKIPRDALMPGDLVFFKTGLFQRHVGIYIEDRSFMHVSTIKGVMISRLDDDYWKRKYWKSKRLIR